MIRILLPSNKAITIDKNKKKNLTYMISIKDGYFNLTETCCHLSFITAPLSSS